MEGINLERVLRNAEVAESQARLRASTARLPPPDAGLATELLRESYFDRLRHIKRLPLPGSPRRYESPTASPAASPRYDWKQEHDAWRIDIGLRVLSAAELSPRSPRTRKRPPHMPLPVSLPPPEADLVAKPITWKLPRKLKGLMFRPAVTDSQPLLHSAPEPPWRAILALAISIPTFTSYLAHSAQFSYCTVAFAGVMPLLGIVSFLLTPIPIAGEYEADEEPPPPLLDLSKESTLLMSAQDSVDGMKAGAKARVASLMAPCSDLIAKCLQLSMGLSAVGQLFTVFSDEPFAVNLIAAICFAVQLPDSAAWLFEVPSVVALVSYCNRYRLRVEMVAVESAEMCIAHAKACATRSFACVEARSSPWDLPPHVMWLQGWRDFLIRKAIRKFNEIGLLVRESPLKSYVVLLNLIVAFKDLTIPETPWSALFSGGSVTWPARAAWSGDNAAADDALQALGPVSASCSPDSAAAWFPRAQSTLVLGYSNSFNVSELALYYVAANAPYAFQLGLNLLSGEVTNSFTLEVGSLLDGSRTVSVRPEQERADSLSLVAVASDGGVSRASLSCPPQLRLQLSSPIPIDQLSLTLLGNLRVGIRGVAEIQATAVVGAEAEFDMQFVEEGESATDDSAGGDEAGNIDTSTLIAATAATTTAAATTEFVRKRVRPDEVQQGREREAEKRERDLERAAAETRLRRSISTPPLEVAINEIDAAIREANEVGVASTLVDVAVEHRSLAVQAKQDLAQRRDKVLEALTRLSSTPPLQVNLAELQSAIYMASKLDIAADPIRTALAHHQTSAEAQKRHELALTRLDRALVEPERRAQSRSPSLRDVSAQQLISAELGETWGLGIDVEELAAAIAEARASGADPKLISEMQRRLRRAAEAQETRFFGVGGFAARLRGLAKARKRRESALLQLSRATHDCEKAIAELIQTRRSALLESAVKALSTTLDDARSWNLAPLSAAETALSDALRLLDDRKLASAHLTSLCGKVRDALQPNNLRTNTRSKSELNGLMLELPVARTSAVAAFADPTLETESTALEKKAKELMERFDKGLRDTRAMMEHSRKMKLSSRQMYDSLVVSLEDALLMRPDDEDGPMLEGAHELFESISAELRLMAEVALTRRALQKLQREHKAKDLRMATSQLESTYRMALKVANHTRDMDVTERAAASVAREAHRLLDNHDVASRGLSSAIQKARLLCEGELMPQSQGERGKASSSGAKGEGDGTKTKLRVGTAPLVKKLVTQLKAVIIEAENAFVEKQQLDDACEALIAMQALLGPASSHHEQAPIDAVARRRSSTRRVGIRRSGSSSAEGAIDAEADDPVLQA